jgi:hypothetical protein
MAAYQQFRENTMTPTFSNHTEYGVILGVGEFSMAKNNSITLMRLEGK